MLAPEIRIFWVFRVLSSFFQGSGLNVLLSLPVLYSCARQMYHTNVQVGLNWKLWETGRRC